MVTKAMMDQHLVVHSNDSSLLAARRPVGLDYGR